MKKQEINIRFLHNSLLINNEILILSDFHIGYEEHIFEQGLISRIQLQEILEKLDNIFKILKKEKISIKKIIILGDLKHEFGGISDSEWRDTIKLLEYLQQHAKEIILIRGNHDIILGPIANKKQIKVKDSYIYKNKDKTSICFIHGNTINSKCLSKDIKYLIMGHLHPAITLSEKYKKEKYKCFLKGIWKNKQVYILPSFSGISFGYDLTLSRYYNYKENSGFLIIPPKQLKNFEVIIYNDNEDKTLNFGKLKKIKI